MRLNCYLHPEYGLWISPGQLEDALKEGKAELCLYGINRTVDFLEWESLMEPLLKDKTHPAILDAFKQLVWHNGLRIKRAVARELKWLSLSLLFCWLPFRHWVEFKVGEPGRFWPPNGYYLLLGPLLVMTLLAFAEICLRLYEHRMLPKRFAGFKISSIRHFPRRPRSPVSRTETTEPPIRLKFWGLFLVVCIFISSIVPVSSSWIIVHPLGGQDYAKMGPCLIRPFSSWYAVPETYRTTNWTLLRLLETQRQVVILELEIEWEVQDPLEYKPQKWERILYDAMEMYMSNIMDALMRAMVAEGIQNRLMQERLAVGNFLSR